MLRVFAETVIEVASIPIMLGIVGVGLVFQALQGAKEGWNDGDTEEKDGDGEDEGKTAGEAEGEDGGGVGVAARGDERPEAGTEQPQG